jgi:hypothetical protein
MTNISLHFGLVGITVRRFATSGRSTKTSLDGAAVVVMSNLRSPQNVIDSPEVQHNDAWSGLSEPRRYGRACG